MPADLGFLTTPPTCSPLDLSSDYFTNFAINSVVTDALTAILPDRYVSALEDAMFFCELKKFILYDAIVDKWMFFVVNNLAMVIGAASIAFVTMWVMLTGLKLMNGTQREPMTVVLVQGAKIVLVMTLISAMTSNTDTVIHTVLGLERAITQIVTGSSLTVDRLIDMNLAIDHFMGMVVEDVTNSVADQSSKRGSSSIFALAMGQKGPAILTSLLVMLAQIAICFSLMLAPLFLFFLLFKSTANMFWHWLKFLFSTFVALAFLSIVSTIAMSTTVSYGMMIAISSVLNAAADAGGTLGVLAEIAIRFITGNLSTGAARVDLGSAATNLAAMGALFAVLIAATPPLIMQLFNTSLGYASNVLGAMGMPRAGLGGAGSGASAGAQGSTGLGYQPAGSYGRSSGGATTRAGGPTDPWEEPDHSFSGTLARQLLNHANSSKRSHGSNASAPPTPALMASGTRGQLSAEPFNGNSSSYGAAPVIANTPTQTGNASDYLLPSTGTYSPSANPVTPRDPAATEQVNIPTNQFNAFAKTSTGQNNNSPRIPENHMTHAGVSDAKVIKESPAQRHQTAAQETLQHSRRFPQNSPDPRPDIWKPK